MGLRWPGFVIALSSGGARSISGGLIFIYSCFALFLSFEIHCFQGRSTRIYEY